MKSCDLTIKPGDWLLGLWWGVLPDGGHHLLLARRVVDKSGSEPLWFIEHCVRDKAAKIWNQKPSFQGGSALATLVAMQKLACFLAMFHGYTERGELVVEGDGHRFIQKITDGARLPQWLSVEIISFSEHVDRMRRGE